MKATGRRESRRTGGKAGAAKTDRERRAAEPGPLSAAGRRSGSRAVWLGGALESQARRLRYICLALAVSVFLVFGRTLGNDFVNFDDDGYVTENNHVRQGLTPDAVAWALTTDYLAYWHPLTWLSHMADCQIYGLRPWGHHLTSVAIHAINAVLLFLVLFRMTGGLWPSAFVAAVFAIHPLRVESVAWVSERKDVLSSLFWILTMMAYARYAERPSSWGRYWTVALVFALGLSAKPMLVTLPFALLLLDYWPLRRFTLSGAGGAPGDSGTWQSIRRLVIEKVPLFALAVVCAVMTFLAQQRNSSISSFQALALGSRVATALTAYVAYIGKVFLPVRLSVLYPLPQAGHSAAAAGGAFALLGALSVLAVVNARKRPYLLVGWLWYLGTLVPVIGLIQTGAQAMADRYTYLTTAGLSVAMAWGGEELARRRPGARGALAWASGVFLAFLAILAWVQTGYWRNSETLFRHALAVTRENQVAHNYIGMALFQQGRLEEAYGHFSEALRISPSYEDASNNLGAVLLATGRFGEAAAHYGRALQASPLNASAHNNLGVALDNQGKPDEAIAHYREALRIRPDYADAHVNLGEALSRKGDLDGGVRHCAEGVRLNPDSVEGHYNLGFALEKMGKTREAAEQYQEALSRAVAAGNAQLAARIKERRAKPEQ